MQEIWKTVVWSQTEAWMPDYEVSTLGNVRTWKPKGNSRKRLENPVLLTPWLSNGYPSVTLVIYGKKKNFTVHRLVAEQFVVGGSIPKGYVVCHIDDDKTNNVYSNLKIGTYSENGKDAVRNKKLKSGEDHPAAKLSDADVDTIRHLVVSLGKTHQEVADIFGVARTTISGIINTRRKKV